ncbi:class I SAM-dependent DNA methyltransferase [Qiania dongpingensis]|uniref:Class I SAM-dependent methyltransferase n=1 Tax=Qiania dongpingensis TaxID=2763669 RepID=A0A7G9G201_9FIRM|nr:class I SAM-dependent methyltransferase [Qiania dongpingensis]QNM04833.1 class I SAM-dependent methyltransferase [Qiania dongpingensis]
MECGSAYTSFAAVYDKFMDNVPYEEWCVYLTGLLREYGCRDCLLADLGCGTGSLTELLSQAGYDMIGIDQSEEMLEIAMGKRVESGRDILYLLQDMREFELFGTVGGIVSICDSMNYITSYEELVQVFRLVNNYLDPGGIFIFDFNTWYKYRELLGDGTIAESRENESFIWDNYFDEETGINEYQLTIFVKADCVSGRENDLYHKYEEIHYQRAYELAEFQRALLEAGMEFVAAYDAFTREAPKEESERIYVVARERGKNIGV